MTGIAENDHKKGGDNFSHGRIPSPIINKKLQKAIIKKHTAKHYNEILHELLTLSDGGFLEYHIPA